MIPNPDQLQTIAKLQHGDLAEIPFAVLLHSLSMQGRSAVLEIERKPMKKEIVLDKGIPVDCRSNLFHEILGRFMVSRGLLTEEQFQLTTQRSISLELPFGECLIMYDLISASDLYKVLQQSLAKKLLDGFTLRSGSFRVLPEPPKVESPLKVRPAQLIVTGISKFALDDEINLSVGPLVGKQLFLHPSPPHPLEEIHLSPPQKELTRLLAAGKRIDEMAAETTVPFDQIMRLLYSLAILGIVVPEEWLPKGASPAAAPFQDDEPVAPDSSATAPDSSAATVSAVSVAPLAGVDPAVLKNELIETYLKYRKQDAYDLLGLEETAGLEEIQEKYLEFSRRFAPWHFDTPELRGTMEKAEDLFLAGGMAFGELCDVERRNALILRRVTLRQQKEKEVDPSRFAIKSDLLDSEQQFKKGKALMNAGRHHEALMQLQFAHDCDPQNATYRAELAYCKYLDSPATGSEAALAELRETLRIDPKSGLANLYAGEIHRELGQYEEAEDRLQKALKLMSPDRRPIEALKALQVQMKSKKKLSFLGR